MTLGIGGGAYLGYWEYHDLTTRINNVQDTITSYQNIITNLQAQIAPYASQYNADL